MNNGYSNYERPQVLLLGNGINIGYAKNSFSWKQLLDKVTIVADRPEYNNVSVPLPLDIIIRTNDNVEKQMKTIHKEMYGNVDNDDYMNMLKNILGMRFDHILTTNYSYEIESACIDVPTISDKMLTKHQKHSRSVERAEPKYLLHTYYDFTYNGHTNNIWHIHGEARKYQSMVIGHYYYGKLLSKYIEILDKQANLYVNCFNKNKNPTIDSWLDAFILGDVYVLGQGLDFSEMDLWWLINRKKREKAKEKGSLYFYEPIIQGAEVKTYLLRAFDCKTTDFSISIEDTDNEKLTTDERELIKQKNNEAFNHFYDLALHDISERMINTKLR